MHHRLHVKQYNTKYSKFSFKCDGNKSICVPDSEQSIPLNLKEYEKYFLYVKQKIIKRNSFKMFEIHLEIKYILNYILEFVS